MQYPVIHNYYNPVSSIETVIFFSFSFFLNTYIYTVNLFNFFSFISNIQHFLYYFCPLPHLNVTSCIVIFFGPQEEQRKLFLQANRDFHRLTNHQLHDPSERAAFRAWQKSNELRPTQSLLCAHRMTGRQNRLHPCLWRIESRSARRKCHGLHFCRLGAFDVGHSSHDGGRWSPLIPNCWNCISVLVSV